MNSVKVYLFSRRFLWATQSTYAKLRLNVYYHKQSLNLIPCANHNTVESRSHFSPFNPIKLQVNTMSGSAQSALTASYEDVVQAQEDSNSWIIDVREQSEINETGKIPGSIHIPMGDVTNTLKTLSEHAFKEKFGKEKPTMDSNIILSCRSGKRSGMVQEEMQKLGYKNVQNYLGGWLDWESKTKK